MKNKLARTKQSKAKDKETILVSVAHWKDLWHGCHLGAKVTCGASVAIAIYITVCQQEGDNTYILRICTSIHENDYGIFHQVFHQQFCISPLLLHLLQQFTQYGFYHLLLQQMLLITNLHGFINTITLKTIAIAAVVVSVTTRGQPSPKKEWRKSGTLFYTLVKRTWKRSSSTTFTYSTLPIPVPGLH